MRAIDTSLAHQRGQVRPVQICRQAGEALHHEITNYPTVETGI